MCIRDSVLYILHYKASKKGSSLHEYQSSLTKIVKRFHAQAGISQHFSNLLLIEDYKIQTLDAIKYGQILNPCLLYTSTNQSAISAEHTAWVPNVIANDASPPAIYMNIKMCIRDSQISDRYFF